MNIHKIIGKFVGNINSSEINFQRSDNEAWVTELETKFPKHLPISFHSLITRYSFNEFDYCGLSFFANKSFEENFGVDIFKDKFISKPLCKTVLFNLLVQIVVIMIQFVLIRIFLEVIVNFQL